MQWTEFYEHVQADPDIEGREVIIGKTLLDDYVIVRDLIRFRAGSRLCDVRVDSSAVGSYTWDTLRNAIFCTDTRQPLYHVTRIVGYFSRIENWNSGKLGELADRRAGDYRLPEDATGSTETNPDQAKGLTPKKSS